MKIIYEANVKLTTELILKDIKTEEELYALYNEEYPDKKTVQKYLKKELKQVLGNEFSVEDEDSSSSYKITKTSLRFEEDVEETNE